MPPFGVPEPYQAFTLQQPPCVNSRTLTRQPPKRPALHPIESAFSRPIMENPTDKAVGNTSDDEAQLYAYLNLSPPVFDPTHGTQPFPPFQPSLTQVQQASRVPLFQLQPPPLPRQKSMLYPETQPGDLDLFFQQDTRPMDANNLTVVDFSQVGLGVSLRGYEGFAPSQSPYELSGLLAPHNQRRLSSHSAQLIAFSEVSSNPNSPFMDALSPSGFHAMSPGLAGSDLPAHVPEFILDFTEPSFDYPSVSRATATHFGERPLFNEGPPFGVLDRPSQFSSGVDLASETNQTFNPVPFNPMHPYPEMHSPGVSSSPMRFVSQRIESELSMLNNASDNTAQSVRSPSQSPRIPEIFLSGTSAGQRLTELNLQNGLWAPNQTPAVRSPSLFSQSSPSNASPNRLRVNSNANLMPPGTDLLSPEYLEKRQARKQANTHDRRASSIHSVSSSVSGNRSRLNSDLRTANQKMIDLASSQLNKRQQKHPATYACDLCEKTFTRPYNLKSHRRTHTNERPFVCLVCGKAFARQHDRKRHEDLHNGEKRYQCRGFLRDGTEWGCSKKFARTDALGRHFKTDAGKECMRPLLEEAAREGDLLGDDGTFDVMEGFNLDPYAFYQQHSNLLPPDDLKVPSMALTPPGSESFHAIDEQLV